MELWVLWMIEKLARDAADELVRSMIGVSDSVCCCCGLGIPLSFLFNSFSTISAAVSRRGPPLPNVRHRRPSISGGSWILAILYSFRVSIYIPRSTSWSIRARTASEATLKRLLNSRSFSSRLSACVFLAASLSVDFTRSE